MTDQQRRVLSGPVGPRWHSHLLWAAGGVGVALFGYVFWVSLHWSLINPDAGYYLSTAEALRTGAVPLRDLHLSYLPAVMWFLALTATVLGSSYEVYLSAVLIFQLLTAVMVYALLHSVTRHRALSFFVGALTPLLMYVYDGQYVILEPFVTFFALAAIYSCLRDERQIRWCFAGGVCQ